MQTTQSTSPLTLDYHSVLHRLLELVTQTAETAGAEGNHRLVLQAAREGARIVTLILKLTAPPKERKQTPQPQAPTLKPDLDSLLNAVLHGDQNTHQKPSPAPKKPAKVQPESGRRHGRSGPDTLEPYPAYPTGDLLQCMFHKSGFTPQEKPQWKKSEK